MCKTTRPTATEAMDAYDRATQALTNLRCAARLLLEASPDEHTDDDGHETRDFLLLSILENMAAARGQLDVLLEGARQ